MPRRNAARDTHHIPMSAPKRVVLSRLAQEDYEDIQVYTVTTWGEEQWLRYEDALIQALEPLAVSPSRGQPRDELRAGARALRVREHVIIYEVTDESIKVARILHGRRNFSAALT